MDDLLPTSFEYGLRLLLRSRESDTEADIDRRVIRMRMLSSKNVHLDFDTLVFHTIYGDTP